MIGVYEAKIKDYGTSETKNGNPQVFIMFEFTADGAQKTMKWFGSFVGGAKDITLKSLIACGLQPQNYGQLVNFRNGVASNMLDLNKILSIDIQEEPKFDDPTKMVSKIQWVNDPNLAPQTKKIDEAKNAQFFGSMGFDGDLIRLAGDMGLPLNNGANATMGNMNQNMNQGQNQNQGQNNQQQMNMNQNQGQQNNGQNFNQNMNQGQQTNSTQQQGQQNNGQQNFSAPF